MRLDPFTLDTIQLLENCSELSAGQLADLTKFMDANRSVIEASLLEGLTNIDEGHHIALKLLKLQSDRLALKSSIGVRRATTQKPLEESQFFMAVTGQVFHTISEWMRVNNVDRITVETLPELEEYITMELLLQNGYRGFVAVEPEATEALDQPAE